MPAPLLPLLLLLLSLLAPGRAVVQRLEVTECPHHPAQCKDPATGDFHADGAEWGRAAGCARLVCQFPEIEIAECDAPPPDSHCQLQPGDPAAAYPDCCPTLACPGGHNHV